MDENPYIPPRAEESDRLSRRIPPPPILFYVQIVGAVVFFGGILGGIAQQLFGGDQLPWFMATGLVNVVLGIAICVFLEQRRRREERKALKHQIRDLQVWRRD
jgi:hypothetical protein